MIKELFGQAVIGLELKDAYASLLQIARPEINVVSAYMPLMPETVAYLHTLDVENRYIKAGVGRDSGYGRDIAHFNYNSEDGLAFHDGNGRELPQLAGRDALLGDIESRAAVFSEVTKSNYVGGFLRILPSTKDNLVWHRDNSMDKRGLQTLIGNLSTLWLPDDAVDPDFFESGVDEDGNHYNALRIPFETVSRHVQQIMPHHMSIHKGDLHTNPLYHSAPGYNQALKMVPGTRVLLTLDQT